MIFFQSCGTLFFEDYILSLNEYGYTKRMDVYFPKQLTPLVQKEKSIKLSKIQKDIDSITYVKEEFYDLLPLKTDNPLVIFHRLYQFIEILIMELFNFQFKKFISDILPRLCSKPQRRLYPDGAGGYGQYF